ncbi:OmpA family protein [Vibrio cyclitrophicus]
MKKLIPILIFILSGNAVANCVNYTEEYTISKTLIGTDTVVTQVPGVLSVEVTEEKNIVQDKKIIKTDAINVTDACAFDQESMSLLLNYQTNKHLLTDKHKQAIAQYLELVDQDKKIVIEGHTDDVGSKAYNKKLSQRRASSATVYLRKTLGLGNRIIEKAFGEASPICKVEENAASGCNRRVILTIQ